MSKRQKSKVNTATLKSSSPVEVFTHEVFGEIRTTIKDNQPYFVAMDVCKQLGIQNSRQAVQRFNDNEKAEVYIKYFSSSNTLKNSQNRKVLAISESGLYKLIFQSRKQEALKFQDWVTSEVLPSIRKHGAYMTDDTLERVNADPEYLKELTAQLTEERHRARYLNKENNYLINKMHELKEQNQQYQIEVSALETQNRNLRFNSSYCTEIDTYNYKSKCLLTIAELLSYLRTTTDFEDITENWFLDLLRKRGYLRRVEEARNNPTLKALEKGLFQMQTHTEELPNGKVKTIKQVYVTTNGKYYFFECFRKNILPHLYPQEGGI